MAFDGHYFLGDDGMPHKPKLTLTGVYKAEVQGPKVVYCATGIYDGQDVAIPETSLRAAAEAAVAGKVSGKHRVPLLKKLGGHPEAASLDLTVAEVRAALEHINSIAPADRPDPMAAVS